MSISDGIEASKGDPRVLLLLNAVLSASFVWIVLVLADFGNVVAFTWERFVGLSLVLMALTFVVTR